ncbi:MAG: hypothetical protein E7356_03005 [Clostridiales bacterium]|nr:hypothetical protein [Clostridiales bacterium]
MKYLKLKEKQQKEINDFPFGFAFSNEQFKDMMKKFGLKEKDTDKIYSIGAGGYIRKTDSEAMHNMFKRHREEIENEIKNDKDGTGFIYEMFRYELSNHEYCVTYDIEPTLDALGLTLDEINKHQNLVMGLKKALDEYKD